MTDDRTDERCPNCNEPHACLTTINEQARTIAAQAATIAEQAREMGALNARIADLVGNIERLNGA